MFKNYFKIAWRNLRRNKTYAAINVMGLSLGIACGILIFVVLSHHLSYDNYHPNREKAYRIFTEFHGEQINRTAGVPAPLGNAFRKDYAFAEKIARVARYENQLISLPNEKDMPKFQEEDGVAFAEPDFFDIFSYPLLRGDKKNANTAELNTAIVTEKIAKKYFADKDPIGKIIRLENKTDFKITGVLKNLPENTDRKQEIYLSYANLKDKSAWLAGDSSWGGVYSGMNCFVLLKPGVTQSTVEKALPGLSKKYYTGRDAEEFQFKLQPVSNMHFDTELDGVADKKYLWAIAFVGIFLIVTACVNFINLATAQALNRAKEVGVRKVLGSLRSQLFWQFIAETALITLFAIGLAIVWAELAMPSVNNLFRVNISLNLGSFQLQAFLLTLMVSVVFFSGSYPGLILARFQPALALKGKLSQKHIGGFSLRRLLVITQFAISQLLVIGTIVIASQMNYSKETDLGFTKDAIVMLPLPTQDLIKMNTLRTRLASVAGVEKLSLCFQAPAAGNNSNTGLRYDNREKDELFSINMKSADDQYQSTFGLKLVAGRIIFPSDTVREFLVNETLIKKLHLGSPQDAIGKTLSVNGRTMTAPIVGVVKDFFNYSFRSNISPVCIMSNYYNYNNCAVKINLANIKPTLLAFEKIWNETYPEFVFKSQFLDERIARFYRMDAMMLKMIQIFAGIAIFIGCLGLYGLVSFMAVRKTKEIGVRKVLGASVQQILWLFGKEFVRLLLIAFVIAAPLAWWVMNKYLEDFEYRIEIGAGIFLLAIGSTFVIAAVTVGYRSVISALANPVKSLRTE